MGKSHKKRKEAANRTNKDLSNKVLVDGASFLYGRVKKALGFSTFEVITSDGRLVKATLSGKFRKTILITLGTITVLEDAEAHLPLQVKGLLCKSDAYSLFKCGILPKNILCDDEENDDTLEAFEFDYSGVEESNNDNDIINIDAI